MSKKLKAASIALACACAAPMILAGCNGDPDYIEGKGKIIKFWLNGDQTEIDVLGALVTQFNEDNQGEIYVDLVQKSSQSYDNALKLTLKGNKAPDVFYVGDSAYKEYAELGYLYDITDMVAQSATYKVEDMWDNVKVRYKYDVDTHLSGTESGRYYAVPKDIGPTVIYYNETYFEGAGIKILSVDEDGLEAFNNGGKDDRGNTKADLGITGEVKEKGFFLMDGQYYFNNQIPMSWQETDDCANMVQEYMRKSVSRGGLGLDAGFGYFTEWWFNYGWTVGGNCVQQIPSESYDCGYYYDFTLMDDTKNYIVSDDFTGTVKVNGVDYSAGQIIDYKDKIDMSAYAGKTTADGEANKGTYRVTAEVEALAANGTLKVLPSQREAFTEFVRLGSDTNVTVDTVNGQALKGYGITPRPTDIGDDSGKINAFEYGLLGMLVDGRYNVTEFRKNIGPGKDANFVWDVAPLPMYKEYDANGNVTVHGVEAGHSGSIALAVGSNSKWKEEAFKFIEYVAGVEGQTMQAEAGFVVPLQKDLANSELFLQSDQSPKNSKIFLDAAAYEIAGDWWMLRDKKWIDEWANVLNSSVRNGRSTLTQFYDCNEYNKTFTLLEKYTAN